MSETIKQAHRADKQKRFMRPFTSEGMDLDEFILQNADPVWLHQNEMWEYIDEPSDGHD